jgi:ribosomal protein S12 methylthiotransferase accessory factor
MIKIYFEKRKGAIFLEKKIKTFLKDRFLIKKFYQPLSYCDEPKLWQYTAKIADVSSKSDAPCDIGYAGGASFEKEKAIIKAACEAIERYCLGCYKEENLFYAAYREIKDKSLPIEEVVSFSKLQLKEKKFANCCWNEKDKFFWVEGYSLFERKKTYIPAQLVFVPYDFRKEKIIRLPISTGGAAGRSFSFALLGGIFEILERDAFMIHYLSKSFGELIEISNQPILGEIERYFRKYRLNLYLINMPTDIKVYNFLALIVDKTGVGPALSAGLKSGLDPLKVAIGAIEECWHSRPWIRDDLNKLPDLEKIINEGDKIVDIKKRGLFWAHKKMLRYAEPWFKNKRKISFFDLKSLSSGETKDDLDYVLALLRKKGHKVYYVDITKPEVLKYGFKVIKTVIPSLHPLYLDESYPYLGGERIYKLPFEINFKRKILNEKEINRVPHFFL